MLALAAGAGAFVLNGGGTSSPMQAAQPAVPQQPVTVQPTIVAPAVIPVAPPASDLQMQDAIGDMNLNGG